MRHYKANREAIRRQEMSEEKGGGVPGEESRQKMESQISGKFKKTVPNAIVEKKEYIKTLRVEGKQHSSIKLN